MFASYGISYFHHLIFSLVSPFFALVVKTLSHLLLLLPPPICPPPPRPWRSRDSSTVSESARAFRSSKCRTDAQVSALDAITPSNILSSTSSKTSSRTGQEGAAQQLGVGGQTGMEGVVVVRTVQARV